MLLLVCISPSEKSAHAAGGSVFKLGNWERDTQNSDFNSTDVVASLHSASSMNNKRCTDCHDFNPLFSHPVEVRPPASMTVPTNLPLTNGRITCVTCHANVGVDHDSKHFNRNNTGIGLCLQCHSTGFSGQDMHASSIGRAHLPQAETGIGARGRSSRQSPGWLDAESISCMTCHDGAIASESGSMSGMSHGGMFTKSSEHPIGEYKLTDPFDSDGPLKPALMLDERIRLFNNQVGCGSCHSIYSQERDLLVMSNIGSKLCLGCHEY